jgi:hypothetical protein
VQPITQERIAAAGSLIAVQVIHAALPPEAVDSERSVAPVLAAVAVVGSASALFGVLRRRDWGRRLLGRVGLLVAVGVLLYHALPIRSPVTDPYFGEESIGLAHWLPAIGSIVIGLWCYAASRRRVDRIVPSMEKRFS